MKKIVLTICALFITATVFAAEPKNSKLCNAVEKKNLEAVKKALAAEPDSINKIGKFYDSPITKAVKAESIEIIDFLMESGATFDSRAVTALTNKKNIVLWKHVFEKEYLDPNKYLDRIGFILRNKEEAFPDKLAKFNDVTCGKVNNPVVLQYVNAENYEETIAFFELDVTSPVNEYGTTFLQNAAHAFNLDMVKYLIDKVDINEVDGNGINVLVYACTAYGPGINFSEPVIENEEVAKINFASDMPFYMDPKSIQQKQLAIVDMLLKAGVDVNNKDKYGWTMLHYASAYYPEGLQELLIENGADVNAKTNFGRTPADIEALRK